MLSDDVGQQAWTLTQPCVCIEPDSLGAKFSLEKKQSRRPRIARSFELPHTIGGLNSMFISFVWLMSPSPMHQGHRNAEEGKASASLARHQRAAAATALASVVTGDTAISELVTVTANPHLIYQEVLSFGVLIFLV